METLKENLGDKFVDVFTNVTNRSVNQTEYLYRLCGYDFWKFVNLELKIMNNQVFYCPGDKEELEKIMKMDN